MNDMQPFNNLEALLDLQIEDLSDINVEELDAGQAFGSWGSFGTFGSAFGCASSVSTGSCVS